MEKHTKTVSTFQGMHVCYSRTGYGRKGKKERERPCYFFFVFAQGVNCLLLFKGEIPVIDQDLICLFLVCELAFFPASLVLRVM